MAESERRMQAQQSQLIESINAVLQMSAAGAQHAEQRTQDLSDRLEARMDALMEQNNKKLTEMRELVEALKNLVEAAKAADTSPIVMVEGAPATPHQRIVDVMAALSEAGISTVGLNTSATE